MTDPKQNKAVWESHTEPLPTLPGKVSGIVAITDHPSGRGRLTTVQCSVCFRTVTDITILAVGRMLFKPDEGPGTVPYRRCRDCHAARRHPEVEEQTTGTKTFGECRVCGKSCRLRMDGTTWHHGSVGHESYRCSGAGKPPKEET